MNRAAVVLILLCSFPAAADAQWRYCGPHACKVCAPPAAVKAVPQSSTVSTTSNSLAITNYYSFNQPVADQGASSFGYPSFSTSYQGIDLGALMTQYGRFVSDGQQGNLALGDKLGSLLGIEGQNRARVAEIMAIGESGSRLANAVKPAATASASRTTIYQNGPAKTDTTIIGSEQTSLRTLAADSLTVKNCAECHAAGGEGSKHWRSDVPLSADDRMAAIRSMIREENRMPKGRTIDDGDIGAIIKELAL